MSSIPLPALAVRPPEQPDMMGNFSKLLAMKQMMGQQQIQQQEIQQHAMELKDQQTMRDLAPKYVTKDDSGKVTGYDADGFSKAALGAGVSPQKVSALQLQQAEASQKLAAAGKENIELEKSKNNASYEAMEGLKGITDPAQRAQSYQQSLAKLAQMGVNTSSMPRDHVPTNEELNALEVPLGIHGQVISDAAKVAETNKNISQGNEADAVTAAKRQESDWYRNNSAAGAPGVPPETVQMSSFLRNNPGKTPSDFKASQAAATAKAELPYQVAKERAIKTDPAIQAAELHLDTAKKAAAEAIADGDPNAAAKLLIDGTVAPSQIISARKPAFAQQAFTAAAQLQPGWSATKADADYKVAASPSNVAFFGSAKSLTDKGGTLDQLKDAAKDIPASQIPVFNTVADAIKASTGSGPVAKYAALALGVADDYSKVMGGGQGSDTSRTQALNLIAAKQSPEQRAASLEGIRGAVSSQTNSRIGNNPVLQKMYGGSVTPSQPQVVTKTYQGHQYAQQPDGSWKLQQ